MKFIYLLIAFSAAPALAAEPCYKQGDKVAVYGAVDMVHFFHAGNGMHVQSLTVRVDRSFCVAPGFPEGTEFRNFQLLSSEDRPLKLKDGQLVKLEGEYAGFGDTAWYSGFPLLQNVKVVKIFQRDPNEVR